METGVWETGAQTPHYRPTTHTTIDDDPEDLKISDETRKAVAF
jgi:hypothetical protein